MCRLEKVPGFHKQLSVGWGSQASAQSAPGHFLATPDSPFLSSGQKPPTFAAVPHSQGEGEREISPSVRSCLELQLTEQRGGFLFSTCLVPAVSQAGGFCRCSPRHHCLDGLLAGAGEDE